MAFCSVVRRYGSTFSVTTPHRQKTGLTRHDTNDTNKASKLCEMIGVGAGVGHHDEAQHDNDDDVCCVGDGSEIATGTQPRIKHTT